MDRQQNIKFDTKPFAYAPEILCYFNVKSNSVFQNFVRDFIYQLN